MQLATRLITSLGTLVTETPQKTSLDMHLSSELLADARLKMAYEQMMAIAPFAYERYQAEYYLRHLRSYLEACSDGGTQAALVDLNSPDISYFTDVDPAKRNAFITDMGELVNDPELSKLANSVKLAVLELNGGLGSSMGIDPALNQSKANGIRFDATSDKATFNLSVMGAKMMHTTKLAATLGTVDFIPANSTITELGWQDFLKEKDLAALPGSHSSHATNRDFLSDRGISIHQSIIQQAFPRLDPQTNELVRSENPSNALAPGGHGQFLYHLYFSGKLNELAKAGTQILVMANADSINATPNPVIAARMLRDDIMGALISTDRTPLDAKGGIFVIKNGKLDIVEMGSVAKGQQEMFTQIGLRKGDSAQPFNTNTIYINIPLLMKHLNDLAESENDEAVHALLMPETIPNKKPSGIQLEGAISSTVLKLPAVRLFNVPEATRSSEFTPLKTPIDVVYYLDSDAYRYNNNDHQLDRIRDGAEAAFSLKGWDGWKNIALTRNAFGHPSFKDLDTLKIMGEIHAPGAIWRGRVEIINDGNGACDLTQIEAIQIDGRLTLDNVRIVRNVDGKISVDKI